MKRTVGEQAWRQRKCDRDSGDRDSGDHDVKRTLDGERDDQRRGRPSPRQLQSTRQTEGINATHASTIATRAAPAVAGLG